MLPPKSFWVPLLAGLALILIALGSASAGHAQDLEGPDTSESTTRDSTGTVVNIAPLTSITVDSRGGPFTYRLGSDLHITGPDNKPLKANEVRPGDEATVFYYYRNGALTVGRIVVLKRATATTTAARDK